MRIKTPALALTALLALAACKGDEDSASETSNENTATAVQETDAGASLTDQYLLALEIPASRNGVEFTVNVDAFCGRTERDENYAANCEAEATSYIQQKFMCSRYPVAAGSTKTNNQAILEAGLTGTYREFPSQYLFTDEELQAGIERNETLFNKRDFFVITDVSDLETATVSHPIGRMEAPSGPLCE